MHTRIRKTLVVSLLFIFVLSFIPIASHAAEQTFTIWNGSKNVTVKASDGTNTTNCWQYAQSIYQKIWGVSFCSGRWGYQKKDHNILVHLTDAERTITVDHVRNFISSDCSVLGSVIRVQACPLSCPGIKGDQCDRHGGISGHNHSMILVAKSSTGFTVLESSGGSRKATTFTWKSFVDRFAKGYVYFKYIKSPNAKDYSDVAIAPTSLSMNHSVYSLNLADTLNLSVTAFPSDASRSVTWESSDDSVATVSSNGVVTARKAGCSTIITARSTVNTNVTVTCLVTTFYQQEDGTLQFTGIKYPHTYNKNKSITWSGKVESDVELESVVISVYNSSVRYTQSASLSSGAKSYNMSGFGDSTFKKLPTGKFTFELIATDVMGRKIGFANDGCQATTSGDQVYYNAPGSYSRPVLKGSATRNGHLYEVYEFEARLWDSDKNFAIEKGGHLATISDTDENRFVCDLLTDSGVNYAYLGGYHNSSGWHWVDGTPFIYQTWREGVPEDSTLNYNAVIGIASPSKYAWVKSFDVGGMMCFVVEYDPVPISSVVLEGDNNMIVGESQTLTTTILPSDAYNKTLVYSSSDTSVATVNSSTGTITARSEGYVTIYATAQDGSGTTGQFSLYVMHEPIPLTGMSICADSNLYIGDKTIMLNVGDQISLTSIAIPSDADNQEVYYISSNSSVADFEMATCDLTVIGTGTSRLWGYTVDDQFSDYLDLVVLPISGTWGNLTWTLNESGVLTVSGSGEMNDFGYGNNSDGWRPYAKAIKKVVIQSGVTGIGDYAFGNSNLTSITIPQTVTRIGHTAFYECENLGSITIPQSVTDLGSWVFGYCKNLTSVNIAARITEIEVYAFYGCYKLNNVTLPTSLTSIASNAFGVCSILSGIEIPSNVKTIGDSAFAYCSELKAIKIPNSVTSIGDLVFINDVGIKIYCYNGSTAQQYADNNGIDCYLLDSLFTSPDFVVPEDLQTIQSEAFSGIGAESIELSQNVTTIGSRAFSDCHSLTKVNIPSSCTSIATDAFANVNGLTIYGSFGSYAETYANNHGIPFDVAGSISEKIQQYMLGYLPDYYASSLDLNQDGEVNSTDYNIAKRAGV